MVSPAKFVKDDVDMVDKQLDVSHVVQAIKNLSYLKGKQLLVIYRNMLH